MPISTHILDVALGRPAAGVPVSLSKLDAGDWVPLSKAVTNADGRCPNLLPAQTDLAPGDLSPGVYRIRFETGEYYESLAACGLFPYVEIVFDVVAGQLHYHIPLLLTANSYTTYRGS